MAERFPELKGDWRLTPDSNIGLLAEPLKRAVLSPILNLYKTPDGSPSLLTQLRFGEIVHILAEKEDPTGTWYYLQAERDGYCGWTPSHTMNEAHEGEGQIAFVNAMQTHLYAKPDLKSPATGPIPQHSRLVLTGEESEAWSQVSTGYWAYSPHVSPLKENTSDQIEGFISSAKRYLHAPYLWGGISAGGLDCSALIQNALYAIGEPCPRDSDMQAKVLGKTVSDHFEPAICQTGDLIFWDGHVGIVSAPNTLLHANAHHMAVAEEELDSAVSRIKAKAFGDVTAIKRRFT